MGKDRMDLGFSDALESFDPADWPPQTQAREKAREQTLQARAIAEASGFRSREARAATGGAAEQGAPVRRRRTGRSAQFNLKARPDTIAAFCAVADRQGWGLGETLEHAVALLERAYAGQDPGGERSGTRRP